jgi:AraC-like DNA-binding protein
MSFIPSFPPHSMEIPAVESERDLLVTGRHSTPHRELQLPMPNGTLEVIDTPAACVFTIPATETHCLCLIPLEGEGRFFHDGFETPLKAFSISGPGKGAIFRTTDRATFVAAWISATATSAYRNARKPGATKVRVIGHLALPAAYLRPTSSESAGVTPRDPQELSESAEALETALLAALEVGWEEAAASAVPRRSSARVEIVQSIWDKVRAEPLDDIPLEEWGRLTDASARTVEYAFTELTGLSPMAFIRVWRFGRARRRLLEGRVKTVKDAAYGYGLMHLGRFSIDYRLQFGESPSETLAKARATQTRPPSSGNVLTPEDLPRISEAAQDQAEEFRASSLG